MPGHQPAYVRSSDRGQAGEIRRFKVIRLRVGGRDAGHRLAALCEVAPGQDHFGALGGQRPRSLKAQPAGAGDDRALALL